MRKSSNFSRILDLQVEAGRADKPAVYFGEGSWTYAALRSWANRVGNGLRRLGVEREQRVLLLLLDGPEFLAAFLGAGRIGAIPVPISPLSRAGDVAHLLAESRAKVAIVSAPLLYLARQAAECGGALEKIVVVGEAAEGALSWSSWLENESDELEAVEAGPDEMAFWLCSSGSTGRPKGVVHLHGSIAVAAQRYGKEVLELRPDDVLFSTAKLYHAYGLGNSLYFPLWAGASALLSPNPPLAQPVFEILQ